MKHTHIYTASLGLAMVATMAGLLSVVSADTGSGSSSGTGTLPPACGTVTSSGITTACFRLPSASDSGSIIRQNKVNELKAKGMDVSSITPALLDPSHTSDSDFWAAIKVIMNNANSAYRQKRVAEMQAKGIDVSSITPALLDANQTSDTDFWNAIKALLTPASTATGGYEHHTYRLPYPYASGATESGSYQAYPYPPRYESGSHERYPYPPRYASGAMDGSGNMIAPYPPRTGSGDTANRGDTGAARALPPLASSIARQLDRAIDQIPAANRADRLQRVVDRIDTLLTTTTNRTKKRLLLQIQDFLAKKIEEIQSTDGILTDIGLTN